MTVTTTRFLARGAPESGSGSGQSSIRANGRDRVRQQSRYHRSDRSNVPSRSKTVAGMAESPTTAREDDPVGVGRRVRRLESKSGTDVIDRNGFDGARAEIAAVGPLSRRTRQRPRTREARSRRSARTASRSRAYRDYAVRSPPAPPVLRLSTGGGLASAERNRSHSLQRPDRSPVILGRFARSVPRREKRGTQKCVGNRPHIKFDRHSTYLISTLS